MHQRICLQHHAAGVAKHGYRRGLSGGDAASHSNVQHHTSTAREALLPRPLLRRWRAAATVLLISIAIVRGPTPPGTGVNAPAVRTTSGCTSPTSTDPLAAKDASFSGKLAKMRSASARSVTTFCPTSITVAPGRM